MRERRIPERLRRGTGRLICLLSVVLTGMLLLSSCGEEPQDAGDIYVPSEVPGGSFEEGTFLTQCSFKVRDGWIYYMNGGIYRVPIEEKLNFEHRETVASREELLGPGEEAILCFTVDAEENLYYCAFSWQDMIPALHKRTAEGGEAYCVTLEKEESLPSVAGKPRMALDAGGNLYVLSCNNLLRFDPEGNLTGTLPLEETADGILTETYLLEVSGGDSFLVQDDGDTGSRRVCRILEGEMPRLEELREAMGEGPVSRLYEGGREPLIQENDGCLYRYDTETGATEKLLCWEDCDIYGNDIQAVMQVSGERLLVLQSEIRPPVVKQNLLLTRTSAEHMARKEQVVLASLSPSNDLEKAVVQFNLSSDQYHVVIERYGSGDDADSNEGALARLDSGLASREDAPDLLDLTALDLVKYVDAGTLTDLYPYIEGSGGIRKEDYLPNLLEGYTFDGKLVCISKVFRFLGVYVMEGRLPEDADWTVEGLMAAAERTNVRLLPDEWSDSMLSGFFGGYLLEHYVDWDEGTCRFDSEAFRSLLEWVRGQQTRDGDSGAYLVMPAYVNGFDGYQGTLMQLGEGTALRGIPSAEGRERFEVSAENALGITENSANREGAWAFLRFYLQDSYTADLLYDFPTAPAMLDQAEKKIVTPQYITGANGEPEEMPRKVMYADGVRTEYYALPQEAADALREVLERIDFRPWSTLERSVLAIVEEEAAFYLNGEKTVEEAADIIQNRVGILVQESR